MKRMTVLHTDFWRSQRVLLTGHTGFIGSWMHQLLTLMGATVYGYSKAPTEAPNLYSILNLSSAQESLEDIAHYDCLYQAYQKIEPTVILHLAAEAIVKRAELNPVATYSTNVMGTINVLELARRNHFSGVMVLFTTDKVYAPSEYEKPFVETDPLGSDGVYDSSKACAELAIQSYSNRLLPQQGVATLRAGNVIGGGDWSPDRLIPDAVRAAIAKQALKLRLPNAIRPWQHVMEPVFATLLLAEKLFFKREIFSGAWNIASDIDDQLTVIELINRFYRIMPGEVSSVDDCAFGVKESTTLKLDTTKARSELGWQPLLDLESTLVLTADWYQHFYSGGDARGLTVRQLEEVIPIE